MNHVRKKSNGMKRHMLLLPLFLVAVVALILGATASVSWAWGGWGGLVELDEAEIFFEENATDKDLGIQFFLDGKAWKCVTIITPDWSRLVKVKVTGNAAVIGLTELFSESAEPSYVAEEDQDEPEIERADILTLFPPGVYKFFGVTVENEILIGEARLTHVIPCAPDIEIVIEPGTLRVEWEEVQTVVHPRWQPEDEDEDQLCIGRRPDIVGYEGVFEMVVEEDDEERVFVNTATLPADAESFTASPEFIAAAAEFRADGDLVELKVEVIAIEASGNKAITEETLWEAAEEEE